MSKVKALGYIGCSVSDSKAWEKITGSHVRT